MYSPSSKKINKIKNHAFSGDCAKHNNSQISIYYLVDNMGSPGSPYLDDVPINFPE
jgi:hypothetical protein